MPGYVAAGIHTGHGEGPRTRRRARSRSGANRSPNKAARTAAEGHDAGACVKFQTVITYRVTESQETPGKEQKSMETYRDKYTEMREAIQAIRDNLNILEQRITAIEAAEAARHHDRKNPAPVTSKDVEKAIADYLNDAPNARKIPLQVLLIRVNAIRKRRGAKAARQMEFYEYMRTWYNVGGTAGGGPLALLL